MTFAEAVRTGLYKAATFSGRASRPEFWLLVLAALIGGAAVSAVESLILGPQTHTETFVQWTNGVRSEGTRQVTAYGDGPLSALWSLATTLPLLSAAWRRLHDTGRPGWFVLIPLAVGLGVMAILLGSLGLLWGLAPDSPQAMLERFAGLGVGLFLLLWALGFGSGILLIVWLCQRSEPGPNRWGPPPGATPPPLPVMP